MSNLQGKFAHNVVHVRARRVGQRGNLRKRGRTVTFSPPKEYLLFSLSSLRHITFRQFGFGDNLGQPVFFFLCLSVTKRKPRLLLFKGKKSYWKIPPRYWRWSRKRRNTRNWNSSFIMCSASTLTSGGARKPGPPTLFWGLIWLSFLRLSVSYCHRCSQKTVSG